MTKRGVTSEEMRQYVDFYVDKKFNVLLRYIDSMEDKMKAIAMANAELIRENRLMIKTGGGTDGKENTTRN